MEKSVENSDLVNGEGVERRNGHRRDMFGVGLAVIRSPLFRLVFSYFLVLYLELGAWM